MNCGKIKEQLSAYIDGEVSEKRSALIEKHLTICAECRQEEQLLRETSRLLKRDESVRAPDGFCEALLAKAVTVTRLPHRSIIYAVRPIAGPRALIKVVAYGMAILLLCVGAIFFAMPPLKRATMVEPLPTYTESAFSKVDDTATIAENSPTYTTMAAVKVAGIWK